MALIIDSVHEWVHTLEILRWIASTVGTDPVDSEHSGGSGGGNPFSFACQFENSYRLAFSRARCANFRSSPKFVKNIPGTLC